MEINSTIAKPFKRFSIPRSASSIGSFTTSNGPVSHIQNDAEETIIQSKSNHKHPPLSYFQNTRLNQPINHSHENHSLTKQITMNNNNSNINRLEQDFLENNNNNNNNNKSTKAHIQKRSSIKSLLTRKFHPVTFSTSINVTSKPKKSHHSFRQLPSFLKRSHSAHVDITADSIEHQNPNTPPVDNNPTIYPLHSNTANNLNLRPINEEESFLPAKSINQLKPTYYDIDDSNPNTLDNGSLNNHHMAKIPLSRTESPTSSHSGRSSASNKYHNENKQNIFIKPSKSSSSVASNHSLNNSILTNNVNMNKTNLTNSISFHDTLNNGMNNKKLYVQNGHSKKERITIHKTMSLKTDVENFNVNKVEMREHSAKKKKVLRNLKSRISLPPEIKNSSTDSTTSQSSSRQDSTYYQAKSVSIQGLNNHLNRSNVSLTNISSQQQQLLPHSNIQLSRNELRQSMFDLGFGKIESYVKLEKLGEGTYATVYKGTSSIINGYVALKEIRLEQEEGAPCTALREVSLLKGLKHNNIVSLYDIIFNKTTLTLVFEYVERDLKQYMDDCANILSMKNVRLFLYQLLRGLEYCHSKKILHRDLKPQNLLINEQGELKLADFGLARIKSFPTKTYSHEVVTLWYRPPDVLLGSTEYSTSIDIWAVGCIFFEMACGRPLFPGTKVDEELAIIFKCLGTPTEQTLPGVSANTDFLNLKLPYYPGEPLSRIASRLDHNGLDLLQKFLRYNPLCRISAYDAMRHLFFSCYPSETHRLGPLQSLLDVHGISLTKDHGSKLLAPSFMKVAISKRSSVHL